MEQVFDDWQNGCLKPVYDYFGDHPPTEIIGPARRDILKRDLYNYKGIQMVDLVHASRGCRFNCYPCCVSYLGRTAVPPPARGPGDRGDGRHRQQPPVHRGQFPGAGPAVGDRPLPRDDPPEEEVVLPSHRGGRRGPRPGRPGRGLVRLSGRSSTRRTTSASGSSAITTTASPWRGRSCWAWTSTRRTTSSGSSIFSWRSNWTWPSSPS